MRLATGYTLKRTDVLLADCQTVADEAVCLGFPKDRIVQFPWGVDLEHFTPEKAVQAGQPMRDDLGWESHFVILCNRTWAPVYGVDVLAAAFVKAADENPTLRLILGGSGLQGDVIRGILSPVEEKVWFPGRVDREKLPGLYGAADLFVSPSHSDGSSVSLMEALASGLPVLVSDIPSNREWVTPGHVGGLFKDGEVSSLKAQLLRMVGDPSLLNYGKKARALAERRADWRTNFKILINAYEKGVSVNP
jgi:glycosyltransferase involved in cell wall biosynthesis